MLVILPILQMTKLRPREGKRLVQGQSSKAVESQDSNTGSLAPAPKLMTPDSPVSADLLEWQMLD